MKSTVLGEEGFHPKKGGGALVRWRFCQLAAKRGHEVCVFAARQPGTPKKEVIEGVKIHRPIKGKPERMAANSVIGIVSRALFSIYVCLFILFHMNSDDIDGVHSASQATHWVAKLLSWRYSVPAINFVGYSPSLNSGERFSLNTLIERVNYSLFVGQAAYCRNIQVRDKIDRETSQDTDVDIIHGILNKDAIRNVSSKLPKQKTERELFENDNNIIMVFIGRLVPIKRPTKALDILNQLPKEYKLIMVGDGPELKNVKRKIDRLCLEDRVHLTGKLEHEGALRILADSDGLVLTSRSEAYPTVVFEGLILNNDVFATPVGVLPNLSHERLHVAELQRIPEQILKCEPDNACSVDERMLQDYSIKRYTDTIMNKFIELT